MKPYTIIFNVEMTPAISEDQIPMIAKCYPSEGIEEEEGVLFVLYSLDAGGCFPVGQKIRFADVKWNHPEFPQADGYYPLALPMRKMCVFSTLPVDTWEEVSNARFL